MSPAALVLPWSFLLCSSLSILLLLLALRLVHGLWMRPRRLEAALRAQGLRGRPYRLLPTRDDDNGCPKTSMPLRCHDIIPYVAPLLHRAIREHGRTCLSSWLGPMPKVTVAHAGLTRAVMSGKPGGHFRKLRRFPALSRLLSAGLPTHEGDKWARHRRIISPAFHLQKLKLMLPAFHSCCQDLVSRWSKSLANSEGWGEIDVWPEFRSLAAHAISRTAFGSSYLQGKRILELQAEQADRISAGIKTIFIPGYLSLPTKNNRRMCQIDNEIESILQDLIGKRMQAMREGESTKDDLLGLMLESNMRESDANSRSFRGMSIKEVMEECKMFYFAGIGTPSTLLTWTIVLLGMHPEWQDRAREEVLALFGKNQPEYGGLSRLSTVTMILYEVLRLYPPATAFIRKTSNETEIGGITYPAGVVIEMPVLLIHHDPDIWGADVHEFRPERFAEGISKASNDPAAFLPFGWGPRICIGQNFALLEAKMAVCMILQHFEFELGPTYTHAPHNGNMLLPKHGAQVKLRALV